MYGIVDEFQLQDACDALQEFYDIKADSLTEVKLAGYVPDLQSLIIYKSFVPIDSNSDPIDIFGIVLERRITYDADTGLECLVRIHPRKNMDELIEDIRAAMELQGYFEG